MLCALLLKILKWRVQQVEKQNLRREERKPGECGRGMRGGVRIEEDRVDMEEEVQGEHEQVSHLYHWMSAVWVDLWHAPAAAESLLTAYFRHPFPKFPNFTSYTEKSSFSIPIVSPFKDPYGRNSLQGTTRNLFQTTIFTRPWALLPGHATGTGYIRNTLMHSSARLAGAPCSIGTQSYQVPLCPSWHLVFF